MRYLITEINQLRLFFTTSACSKINSSDLQVDGDFDDVDAHVDDVPAWGAVVPGARVALERVGEIAAVQEVITEVVVASSDAFLFIKIFRLGNRSKANSNNLHKSNVMPIFNIYIVSQKSNSVNFCYLDTIPGRHKSRLAQVVWPVHFRRTSWTWSHCPSGKPFRKESWMRTSVANFRVA